MDVFFNRFPLVSNHLLNLLDDTTLLHCKEASRELNDFIQNEKIVWLRIIRLYKGNIIGFEDSWKKTIEKDSVGIRFCWQYQTICHNHSKLFIAIAEHVSLR